MRNILKIIKGIMYRNKWFIAGLLSVFAISTLLVYLDKNIDEVEGYLSSSTNLIERAGKIKKLNLKTIVTSSDPKTQLPYTKYIYIVYGEKGKVKATVLVNFNNNTEKTVNSINLVEIISIE